ncbi:DUF3467 domain-containing protein [candidate division WOR-3 bacterium]|nr:DUF3467 domain-containing protein [candidate division WOR-3 bacterium]
MEKKDQEIKVRFPEKLMGGSYANHMIVLHTKEEFIMDFIMASPPAGSVTARVITSPGHMKRIINALQDNVNKYEDKFGKIKEAQAPKGFIAPEVKPA